MSATFRDQPTIECLAAPHFRTSQPLARSADHITIAITIDTDGDGRRTTFAFDSGGRRTNERWLTSSGGTVRTITYTYDADGNNTVIQDPIGNMTTSSARSGARHPRIQE